MNRDDVSEWEARGVHELRPQNVSHYCRDSVTDICRVSIQFLMTFLAICWGSLTLIFSSHNHVSSEKVKAYCSAPVGHVTCFQHFVDDSNGLKMQTKLFPPASIQNFCTKISIAKGTHTLIYQALISLIDSKQRRHHNFRGRLITQQLHRTKHRLLWKVKKVLQNIHPSMYSTFRIYMISITLCATVLCCYGWSSSSTSSYWDDPASYSRLRLLSPFWMALLTARTTHFIFLQLEEAILIKRQNLDQTSPLQLFVILKMATSRYRPSEIFWLWLLTTKCCSVIFQSWKKILHFFIHPVICFDNMTMIAGLSFFSVPRLSR